jgi:cell division septation protein DedD
MSEPGFREIQLNTKQVVFLFIACVAAAVGIFLLGVSVGKGVTPDRPDEVVQATDPAADVTAGGAMPPATSPKPDELRYHEELQNKAGAKPAPPPTPADAPPEQPPASTPAPTPTAAPPASAKPPSAQGTKPASSSSGYYVQVNSFASRAYADREVRDLKTKGINAFIFEAPGPGPRYKVRVGPYADSADARAMQARLRKEGFTPSVTR